MNWLNKYRNNKRLALVAGIFLAFTVLTTQSFTYYFQSASQEICSELTDQDASKPEPQFLSQDAVSVSSIQLNLDKPFQVVFEYFLSEEKDAEAEPASMPLNLDFFKNLFRITISPNAP